MNHNARLVYAVHIQIGYKIIIIIIIIIISLQAADAVTNIHLPI